MGQHIWIKGCGYYSENAAVLSIEQELLKKQSIEQELPSEKRRVALDSNANCTFKLFTVTCITVMCIVHQNVGMERLTLARTRNTHSMCKSGRSDEICDLGLARCRHWHPSEARVHFCCSDLSMDGSPLSLPMFMMPLHLRHFELLWPTIFC